MKCEECDPDCEYHAAHLHHPGVSKGRDKEGIFPMSSPRVIYNLSLSKAMIGKKSEMNQSVFCTEVLGLGLTQFFSSSHSVLRIILYFQMYISILNQYNADITAVLN